MVKTFSPPIEGTKILSTPGRQRLPGTDAIQGTHAAQRRGTSTSTSEARTPLCQAICLSGRRAGAGRQHGQRRSL